MASLNWPTIRRWLPAVGWMVVIFTLSSQSNLPGPQDSSLRFLFMKTGHLLAYAILVMLYQYALGGRRWGWALLLTLLYALSDEYHQRFTATRTPALRDIGFDFAGALLGLGVWPRLRSTIAGTTRSLRGHRGQTDDGPPA